MFWTLRKLLCEKNQCCPDGSREPQPVMWGGVNRQIDSTILPTFKCLFFDLWCKMLLRLERVEGTKIGGPKVQLEDFDVFCNPLIPTCFEFWSSDLAGFFGLWLRVAKSPGFAPRQIPLQQTGDRVRFCLKTSSSANF